MKFVSSALDCRVCDNGLLVFMFCEDSGAVSLECEECLTSYRDPGLLLTVRGEERSQRLAQEPEIQEAGWGQWISQAGKR